jgi:hypothetical protein
MYVGHLNSFRKFAFPFVWFYFKYVIYMLHLSSVLIQSSALPRYKQVPTAPQFLFVNCNMSKTLSACSMWSVISVFLCDDDFCWYYFLAT